MSRFTPKRLLLHLISAAGGQWLRFHGAKTGRKLWILGFPDIKRASGSSILIGDEVSLFSTGWANPLRPFRKVSLVTLQEGACIRLGRGVGISSSVISCSRGVTIGDGSLIGADCLIADSDYHPIPLKSGKPPSTAAIHIGCRVFIGTRTVILKGVRIGDDSVIGAGSVVTRDIPPDSVAAGNPAVVIKSLG